MSRFPYVSSADVFGFGAHVRNSRLVRQDDNKGVGGGEGERELVRPLSRLELARIVPLAKQRVAGRVSLTSPSEWIALRKLQVQQAGVIVNWPFGMSQFLEGETKSGYKGIAFVTYRGANYSDPPRRSTLCAHSTCGARWAPSDSNYPIRTLVCGPRSRAHAPKDAWIDRGGLGIELTVDATHG